MFSVVKIPPFKPGVIITSGGGGGRGGGGGGLCNITTQFPTHLNPVRPALVWICNNFLALFFQSRICKECGSIVSPVLEKATPSDSTLYHTPSEWKCQLCQDKGKIDVISVPYVFRYLVAELAAMNIKVKVEVS